MSDSIVTATDLNTFDNARTGVIDASSIKNISGSISDINTAYSSDEITGLDHVDIFLNESVSLSELNLLESKTKGKINIYKIDTGNATFSMNGIKEVGNLLSIKEEVSDPEGTGQLTYSWQSSIDNNNWTEIGKDPTYEIATTDEGKYIKALISYQDSQGFDETFTTSSATIPFIDDGVGTFSISGAAAVGNTLRINEDFNNFRSLLLNLNFFSFLKVISFKFLS